MLFRSTLALTMRGPVDKEWRDVESAPAICPVVSADASLTLSRRRCDALSLGVCAVSTDAAIESGSRSDAAAVAAALTSGRHHNAISAAVRMRYIGRCLKRCDDVLMIVAAGNGH